ncbi:MAG: thiamine-phosphate kinase [candidate division WOR-3 bacterium]
MKNEFEFIRFLKKYRIKNKRIVMGIGDDSAAILPSKDKYILLTSDSLCEDIHFKKNWMDLYKIGRKLILRGLSDIVACGGVPLCANVDLKIPKENIKNLKKFYDGIFDVSKEYNFFISGGDLVIHKDKIIADVFLIGEVERENLILRKGAKENDIVCVTGDLGLSNLAIDILNNKIRVSKKIKEIALEKFYNPKIHLKEIRKILKKIKINSMIDISDGLSKDMNHIAVESNAKIIIFEEKIPVAKEIFEVKIKDPFEYAINSGEEYELIFTTSLKDYEKIKNFKDIKITKIGEVLKGKGVYIKKINGEIKPLKIKGYDKFYLI